MSWNKRKNVLYFVWVQKSRYDRITAYTFLQVLGVFQYTHTWARGFAELRRFSGCVTHRTRASGIRLPPIQKPSRRHEWIFPLVSAGFWLFDRFGRTNARSVGRKHRREIVFQSVFGHISILIVFGIGFISGVSFNGTSAGENYCEYLITHCGTLETVLQAHKRHTTLRVRKRNGNSVNIDIRLA